MIQQGLELSCMPINQLLEDNVKHYTGERYSHEPGGIKEKVRPGFNPGSVKIGSQKIPIRIPRIRDQDSNEGISLDTWDEIKKAETPSEELLKSILLGISIRDYKKVITKITGSFGVSKSSVSQQFIESSTVFGKRAVIQKCTWHKRENIVSYLNESNQEEYRKRLQHN